MGKAIWAKVFGEVSPTTVRWIAEAILAMSGLLALLIIVCEASQLGLFTWPIGYCGEACTRLDEGKVRWIAAIMLAVLVVTQWLVHRLDELIGEQKVLAAGIVGRYRQLPSPPSTESAPPAPSEDTIQSVELTAATVACGIALAKANERDTALALRKSARFHETDKSAVRAFISKQSIFAALTLFLLKDVSTKLPSIASMLPLTLQKFLYVASAFGFLFTLLTVLAAIQTYSTYVRIQWDETTGIALLKKGRRFDEMSFYLLTVSLLVVLCAYQPSAALITMPVFGVLLYKYYFFKP